MLSVPRERCRATAVAVLLVCLTGGARAQYYEESRSYVPAQVRYVSLGFFMREFVPRSGNTAPDSLQISYRKVMPLVGFHQGPMDILFGYTNYDLQAASCSAVYLGLSYTNDVVLAGTPKNALVLPILIAADYTKSESAGSLRDQFNVGSLGVGTGLKYRVQSPSVDFSVTGAALIQYSFEAYSLQGGSSSVVAAEAVALLKAVPVLDGIVLGYRYRLQNWAVDHGRLDYRSVNHGAFVGVLF